VGIRTKRREAETQAPNVIQPSFDGSRVVNRES
jgi:hypothetical protein